MIAAPYNIAHGCYGQVKDVMFTEVGNDDYHALPGVSSSNIRDIADDVDQYMRGPLPHEPSDAKLLGSAAHCFIIQPEWFDMEYVVYPGKVRRGKQWDEFVEEHTPDDPLDTSGKEIITTKMYERCVGMRDSLAANGYDWLWEDDKLVRESSVWAYEASSSILCKIRPDVYDPELCAIVDLKTTSNPHWEGKGKYQKGFKYSVRKFGYYIQDSFYTDILNTAGVRCDAFNFLCVQSNEPYDVVSHTLTSAWKNDGRREYIKQLGRLRTAVMNS